MTGWMMRISRPSRSIARRVWVSIFWLMPGTWRPSAVQRVALVSQHLQHDHGPFVGDAANQIRDQCGEARVDGRAVGGDGDPVTFEKLPTDI